MAQVPEKGEIFLATALSLRNTAFGRGARQEGMQTLYSSHGVVRTEITQVRDLAVGVGGWIVPWKLFSAEAANRSKVSVFDRLRDRIEGWEDAVISPEAELTPGQRGTSRVLVYRGEEGILRAVGIAEANDHITLGRNSSSQGYEQVKFRIERVSFPIWGNWHDDPEGGSLWDQAEKIFTGKS